jgi:hypothetical protein
MISQHGEQLGGEKTTLVEKKPSRCSIVFRRHHHHCGRSSTARIGSKDVVPDRPGACLVIEDRQGRWRLAYERTSIGPERPYGMMMTAAVAAAWSILDLHNQTFSRSLLKGDAIEFCYCAAVIRASSRADRPQWGSLYTMGCWNMDPWRSSMIQVVSTMKTPNQL